MIEHAHVPRRPCFFLWPFLVFGIFFQVYGWGVTEENGFDLAEKLQELEASIQLYRLRKHLKYQLLRSQPFFFKVPIVSDAVCRPAMEGQGFHFYISIPTNVAKGKSDNVGFDET